MTITTERLVPKPHFLKSIRNRPWSLAGALEELIDNSICHGGAKRVEIVVDMRKGIQIMDNGKGMDNINRLFTLGDSSAYENVKAISMYGVGATNAIIWLGDVAGVSSVSAGREHAMTVDWGKQDKLGEWPAAYSGNGHAVNHGGTTVTITKLSNTFQSSTCESAAQELGRVFAPALRSGVIIDFTYKMATPNSKPVHVEVKPFRPEDLTDVVELSGDIDSPRGILRWTGRAGLSSTLKDSQAGVHIAFGHRIIETTKEPFAGNSSGSVWVEIHLNNSDPWKYSLSDHKDKIVGRNREPLMSSIHEQIKPLLEVAAEQAKYLSLRALTAPIENNITRALQGAGVLHVDPETTPEEGGHGNTKTVTSSDEPKSQVRTPASEGAEAKPVSKPTGVVIHWTDSDKMEGRLFKWDLSGKQIVLTLDCEAHEAVTGCPPKIAGKTIQHILFTYIAEAVASEYLLGDESAMGKMLGNKMRQRVKHFMDTGQQRWLTPLIAREFMDFAE